MSTTLEVVDRAVETPIPQARRRRFWLVWWLWGIFGTAFSMRGIPDGTWLAVALLLTSPFWALFVLWPCLWVRDRLRAKRLWAESVSIILAEVPESSVSGRNANNKRSMQASAAETVESDDIAIPVVIGRDGVLVPVIGWQAAFPTLDEKTLSTAGVSLTPADTFPGVHVEGFMADALVAAFAETADHLPNASASQNETTEEAVFGEASADDLAAAHRWCAELRRALAMRSIA